MGPVTHGPSLPEDKPAEQFWGSWEITWDNSTLENQACLCLLLGLNTAYSRARGQKRVQETGHLFLIWACSWQTSR